MLPFAAFVAYSLALHAALLQRRCSHLAGGKYTAITDLLFYKSRHFFTIQ